MLESLNVRQYLMNRLAIILILLLDLLSISQAVRPQSDSNGILMSIQEEESLTHITSGWMVLKLIQCHPLRLNIQLVLDLQLDRHMSLLFNPLQTLEEVKLATIQSSGLSMFQQSLCLLWSINNEIHALLNGLKSLLLLIQSSMDMCYLLMMDLEVMNLWLDMMEVAIQVSLKEKLRISSLEETMLWRAML